jgi:hypothetical protein
MPVEVAPCAGDEESRQERVEGPEEMRTVLRLDANGSNIKMFVKNCARVWTGFKWNKTEFSSRLM